MAKKDEVVGKQPLTAATTIVYNPLAGLKPATYKFVFKSFEDAGMSKGTTPRPLTFAHGSINGEDVRILVMRRNKDIPATATEGSEYDVEVKNNPINGFNGAILALPAKA